MFSEMSRRSSFDDFVVVWIIEQEDAENNLIDTELDRIRNSIKILNDPNKCVNYITDATNENIFLVIPNSLTEIIISQFMSWIQHCPRNTNNTIHHIPN
jgi:hypothetical protein